MMMAQAGDPERPRNWRTKAFDALVTVGETVVIDQILVDRLGVPALAERQVDEVKVRLAGAGRGAPAGYANRVRLGGHLLGFVGRLF